MKNFVRCLKKTKNNHPTAQGRALIYYENYNNINNGAFISNTTSCINCRARENGVIVSDQLPPGEYTATVENVFPLSLIDDVRAEEFVIEKEPSWVRLNRGKMSKRQRRKHNP